ncbi:hypothetical protein [Paraglaciecola arctica]|uniref:hypothetical protein n=1 Tax=Paraglaciecola arctica TaxID=1128911 RepID=UPI001C0714AD|nr:hypothetical protein [Paraglaciecola arctica]MBU3003004.1 hypothetical protein [Paraglaciecola arctica]
MRKGNYFISFVVLFTTVQMFITVSAVADGELIKKLDLDKDGQITIKEAVANPAVLASFGKIDTDGDGKISSLELANTKVNLVKDKNTDKPEERI